MAKLYESGENYLETILVLQAKRQPGDGHSEKRRLY